MIFGDCPYEDCDGTHAISSAEHTPAFSKEKCEKCGREYWMFHSRIVPEAYTLEAFANKYDVDEETRSITLKVINPPIGK